MSKKPETIRLVGPPEAVLYTRVSTKDQKKEGFSIPAQAKLLRAYATDERFNVLREFEDDETAKRAGRTGFGEMVKFLKAKRSCRVVLVEKTDRLYRNLKDYGILDELDLEIHFVKEHVVLSKTSRSQVKLMHDIRVVLAKNYCDNLSEEAQKGQLEKAEEGIWPGKAALGYSNVKLDIGKRGIEPDPKLDQHITRMYERYAVGNVSIEHVRDEAHEDGVRFRRTGAALSIATVHKILRNRIYTGDFEWAGKAYKGIHKPLVSRDLWDRVQSILDRRHEKKNRKVKHDFAFSGLITCGHCDCALVGELKKRQYVYYHCTGYKQRCLEPYTREEVLEERFTELLRGLAFDDEVLAWVTEGLRQSHVDEKHHHDDAIARLHAEYTKLQTRIDAMYIDKLDARIDAAFFDQKAGEWRAEQARIKRSIDEHETANQNYLDEGVMLLEVVQRAPDLFEKQPAAGKRRLLNFVLSNCSWKGGELTVTYRQPFDIIATSVAEQAKEKAKEKAAGVASNGRHPALLGN